MRINRQLSKITVFVNKNNTNDLIENIKDIGFTSLEIETARKDLLYQEKGLKKILKGETSIKEESVDIIHLRINSENEKLLLNNLVQKSKLDLPGKGMITCKEMIMENSYQEFEVPKINFTGTLQEKNLINNLVGVTCVVQKGAADTMGRFSLDLGVSIPYITYGIGTGVRNRIGLWRVLIPAEKEILNFILEKANIEHFMNLLIDVGKLGEPGKGFIYTYPIRSGLIDTKMYSGSTNQIASIEQIIATIDEIKGNNNWRERNISISTKTKERIYLKDLINLNINCNEGYGSDVAMKAIEAGAPGATIMKATFVNLTDKKEQNITPARELITMTISEKQVTAILEELENKEIFNTKTAALAFTSKVNKAFTYLGK